MSQLTDDRARKIAEQAMNILGYCCRVWEFYKCYERNENYERMGIN
jgi:hypothetical protein